MAQRSSLSRGERTKHLGFIHGEGNWKVSASEVLTEFLPEWGLILGQHSIWLPHTLLSTGMPRPDTSLGEDKATALENSWKSSKGKAWSFSYMTEKTRAWRNCISGATSWETNMTQSFKQPQEEPKLPTCVATSVRGVSRHTATNWNQKSHLRTSTKKMKNTGRKEDKEFFSGCSHSQQELNKFPFFIRADGAFRTQNRALKYRARGKLNSTSGQLAKHLSTGGIKIKQSSSACRSQFYGLFIFKIIFWFPELFLCLAPVSWVDVPKPNQ